jgi:cobyrinic acid a,c-diamide synthase
VNVPVPRVVLAGTHSAVGKTTVTIGLLRALSRRGMALQSFKVGPDFLDPTYHREALGIPSGNLDSWMAGRSFLRKSFIERSTGKDMAIIEGVMGLFDGRGSGGEGSTAEVAGILRAPVILIVDCRGASRSLAAQVVGFKSFDRSLRLAGVLLNHVGSEDHARVVRESIESRTGIPVLGALPRRPDITLSHRHLGLVSANGESLPKEVIEAIADLVDSHVDLDGVIAIAQSAPPLPFRMSPEESRPESAVHIGVALDEAFHFYYAENLDLLEASGASLIYFSPLHNTRPPAGLDGLYLGGGYPELFLPGLSSNRTMRDFIRDWALAGKPIYGECGGFLYLLDEVKGPGGETFPLAGVFPFQAVLRDKKKTLGYVEVEAMRDNVLLKRGSRMRGHEFHYTELIPSEAALPDGTDTAFRITYSDGRVEEREGFSLKNTLAGYTHLYFPSLPGAARRFVERCRRCAELDRRQLESAAPQIRGRDSATSRLACNAGDQS